MNTSSTVTADSDGYYRCIVRWNKEIHIAYSSDGWLIFFRIYVALAVFQLYRDLEAGDNQSLKFNCRGGESNL